MCSCYRVIYSLVERYYLNLFCALSEQCNKRNLDDISIFKKKILELEILTEYAFDTM